MGWTDQFCSNSRHKKNQEESHKEMQSIAESMSHLADQLNKLRNSEELCGTISKFPEMMEEVVDFIHSWLEIWLGAYLSVWDETSTELLVQPNTSSLSLRRTELSSCRRRWMDIGTSLLQISL